MTSVSWWVGVYIAKDVENWWDEWTQQETWIRVRCFSGGRLVLYILPKQWPVYLHNHFSGVTRTESVSWVFFVCLSDKLYRCLFVFISWNWRCLNVIFEHLWVNASQPVAVMVFWQKLFSVRHKYEIVTILTVVRSFVSLTDVQMCCIGVQQFPTKMLNTTSTLLLHKLKTTFGLLSYRIHLNAYNYSVRILKLHCGCLESSGLFGGITQNI